MLTSYGIKAPKIYFRQQATWLEQNIPYELESRVSILAQDHEKLLRLLMQLHVLAIVLGELGFSPIDPFGDLRTDDEDVYVVDFGTDLGPPSVKSKGYAYEGMLIEWLVKVGIHPNRDLLAQSRAEALATLSEQFSNALSHYGKAFESKCASILEVFPLP